MRLPWLPLLFCACLVSCDKVKQAVADAKAKASSSGNGKSSSPQDKGSPGGAIDQALEAQIDRTEEGVRFRKDLPFPPLLTVREKERMESKGLRFTRQSALGKEASIKDGTEESVHVWKREGDRLTLTIERQAFIPTPLPAKDSKEAPVQPAAVESESNGLSATFKLTNGKWKTEGRSADFKRMVWLEQVEPVIGSMASHSGALPSGFWFGKPRFKEGSAISLTGDGLKLLFRDAQSGKLDLVFEGVEGIGGHPCGRFSVRGMCTQRNLLREDGKKTSCDYMIDSGKVWLSLLHPVVLRKEMDAAITMSGDDGGTSVRMQGAVKLISTVEWKPGS
ncbi:hypothetical protein KBB96_12300 [Luteolibacter ambystomatis]|uniref:Uncharacterized protein n=1 Tax=Luteolibacter ambystomatis TaxID=2824561 RepID=A0A975G638_9BACT|nr:hypothetical protein [Luteolibacter ambystomatis]QUE49653.1 hypothetical protein KBB96_12300 [Luteolibacter ambystomatis]